MYHARIQDFFSGGRRVLARRLEKSLDNVVFCFCNPQYILQFTEGIQWFYYGENYTFSKDPEGFQFFSWGGGGVTQLFPGGGDGSGTNAYFYRNPYNL